MANDNEITIEVAYGTAEQQRLYRFRLPANSTARQAALAAPVLNDFPEAQPHTAPLGIFGKAVKDSHILREGARCKPTPKKHGANARHKTSRPRQPENTKLTRFQAAVARKNPPHKPPAKR